MNTYSYSTTQNNGGYSAKFSTLQQHHLDQLREEVLGQRGDVAVKNKKLSAETNKRRRELVNKKKARETEEEDRRKEILAERKARIQDVTYRYQRGSAPKTNHPTHHHNHRTRPKSPRTRRAVSAPVSRPAHINLDDALKTIRGNGQQQQYNIGDSGAVFLQKYGAHIHHAGSGAASQHVNSTDATPTHSLSVREYPPNGPNQSQFEQQLAQHQVYGSPKPKSKSQIKHSDRPVTSTAIIHQTKTIDQIQTHNERLVQDLRLYEDSKPTQSLNNMPLNDDAQSVESLDSLESEQPSNRSHQIDVQPFPYNTHLNQPAIENDHDVGGGTYRQESPTVIQAEFRAKANTSTAPKQGRAHSAPVQRQLTKTQATPTTDTQVFLGFQVVNSGDYSKLNKTEPNKHKHSDTLAVERIAAENFYQQSVSRAGRQNQSRHTGRPSEQTEPHQQQPENHSILEKTDDGASFYLKSRTESQTTVSEFPPQAWGTPENSSRVEPPPPQPNPPTNHPYNPPYNPAAVLKSANTHQHQDVYQNNNNYSDGISDTASDCGPPVRSILKKRGSTQGTLSRSQSTPSIRDSLEITKEHRKGGGKVETPKSAKKSVRFTTFGSEPVLFQKGSSPSSIPRPVRQQPPHNRTSHNTNKNVPHISSAITPSVSDKPISSKPSTTSPHRGPVVANHDIQLHNNNSAPSAKPNISDIRLDRTPTDDEIDVLWDRVRDCLQETPTGSARSAPVSSARSAPVDSVRSAPGDLQQQFVTENKPTINNSSLPPKPPIKKITASNINQIGKSPSAQQGMPLNRGRSGSDPSLHQSTLQRPKQNQTSFITTPEHQSAHNQLMNGYHHSPAAAVPGHVGNGYTTVPGHVGNGYTSPHYKMNGHVTAGSGGGSNTPIHSSNEPNMSVMVNNSPHDVSESMMSFMAAEALSGHESMSDHDILRAMSDTNYRQKISGGNNNRPVAPMSALSMEEQRILQSLDRLNNKLKVVEDVQNSARSTKSDCTPAGVNYNGFMSPHNYTAQSNFANPLINHRVQHKPHPPNTGHGPRSFSATPRGFRGHRPIQPRQRTSSAESVRAHNSAMISSNNPTNHATGSNRQFRLY